MDPAALTEGPGPDTSAYDTSAYDTSALDTSSDDTSAYDTSGRDGAHGWSTGSGRRVAFGSDHRDHQWPPRRGGRRARVFSAPEPSPSDQPAGTPWTASPDALDGADDAFPPPLTYGSEAPPHAPSARRDEAPDSERFGPAGGDHFASPGEHYAAPANQYDDPGSSYESPARWFERHQDWYSAPTARGEAIAGSYEPPAARDGSPTPSEDPPYGGPASYEGAASFGFADRYDSGPPYEEPAPYEMPREHPSGGRRRRVEPTFDQPFPHLPSVPQPNPPAGDSGGRWDPSGNEAGSQEALDVSPSLFDYPSRQPHYPGGEPHYPGGEPDYRAGQFDTPWGAAAPLDRYASSGYSPELFDDLSTSPESQPLTGPLPDHGWSRTGSGGGHVSDVLPESTAASEVTTGFHALRDTGRRPADDGRPQWGGDGGNPSTGHHHDPELLGDPRSDSGGRRRSHRREDPDTDLGSDDLVGPVTEPMVMLPPVHLTAEPGADEHDLLLPADNPSGTRTRSARTPTPAAATWQAHAHAEADRHAASTPDLDGYPDDLRPRRRAAGRDLTATALGRPMSSPMVELGADLSTGPSEPIALTDLGDERESAARGLDVRFTGGQAARSAGSSTPGTARSARSGRAKRSGHRVRRTRPVGLPAFLAVPVAILGGLGAAFLDLYLTGHLGVLFSLGFVLTSFGVAAGIRRSDIFTAGVLPPLAALATFAGIGVTSPERLGGTSSPVVAVLSGLATESWTLVAASSLTLGTIALRVAVARSGSSDLSAEGSFAGPSAAQVAARRSGSRPPF
ncbi:DUF6542 domain-containing protein [Actinopolymorpha sp. B11F2]|uniref:DUF6542 domain-containing protein n=1 Tax=Actinopolymorpha sp. B11F2 TaxID=3160862 RepID=UPI0032E3EF64